MGKMLSSKIFWSITILFSLVVFIFNLNLNRAYLAQTEILLLPKNEAATQNISQIMENASLLPLTLSFYENHIATSDEVIDEVQELPGYKKLDFWQKKINLEKIGQSGIIRISVADPDQWQAEALAQASAKGLSDELSRYYNIRTELETRIVDGPILRYSRPLNKISWTAVLSFLVGLAISMFLYLLYSLFSQISMPVRKSPRVKFSYTPPEAPEFSEPVYPIEEPFEFFEETPAPEPTPVTEIKKSFAPSNLPVVEEEVQPESKADLKLRQDEHILASVNRIASKHSSREASPEEVKARLNRLLRGDM
jgi:capsular polysaccharide biosynthesis protein